METANVHVEVAANGRERGVRAGESAELRVAVNVTENADDK